MTRSVVDDEQARRARLAERVEHEQAAHLPHRRRADGAHALARAREIARGRHERGELLALGRHAVAADVDAPDVEARARLPRARERAEDDERAARRDLGVATVGLVDAEERGDLLGLAREDAAAVARDGVGARAIGERGVVATGQLDDERRHLATLAHADGALDVDERRARLDLVIDE